MQSSPPNPTTLALRTAALTWVGAALMLAGLAIHVASKREILVGPLPLYEVVMGVGAVFEVLASWRIWLWLRSRRERGD